MSGEMASRGGATPDVQSTVRLTGTSSLSQEGGVGRMFGVTTACVYEGGEYCAGKGGAAKLVLATSATRRDRLAGDLVLPASRCRRQPNKDTKVHTRHLYTAR